MKIVKIIILLIITASVIFLVETNIKKEYSTRLKKNAEEKAQTVLQNQIENIREGLKTKRNNLIDITNAISNQDTFDSISGILAGNSNTFEWIEYVDSNGVPKYTTKKVPEEPQDYIYTMSTELEDGSKLNIGINLRNFLDGKILKNISITKNPSSIFDKYRKSNYIISQKEVSNTDISLVYYKNISSKINSILFLEIAVGILALVAVLFIIFKKRNKEFDTIDTFMDQVKKGNEDLRFEIIEKDPLSNLKTNINNILDKLENLRDKNRIYSFAISTINKMQSETSLNKKINVFIKELIDDFNLSNIHVFLKTNSKNVVYTNKSNQYNLNYTANMEKIIQNKQSNILKDFDINSLLDVQINEDFYSKNYKIFHISNHGIILFEKEEFEKINTSVGKMLINTIINNIKLHKDKIYNLQEKLHFNKMFKKLNTGLVWVDHEGHIKLINRYIEKLFEINFDVEGMLVGQFFNKIGLNFKPIADSFNSNKEKKYTVEYKNNLEFEIATTFIPITQNQENDFIISIKNISSFKSEEKEIINNQSDQIKNLNEEVTTLQNRIQSLQTRLDEISENNIDFSIIDPITNDIIVNSTRMLKALNRLRKMLFDDSEKKYVSFLKNQLYHINFSIRNFSIYKGDINYNMKNNDVTKILKKSFNFYKNDLKNKDIKINSYFEESIDNINCDKINLGISFNNILYQIVENSQKNSELDVDLYKENETINVKLELLNPKETIETKIPKKNDISDQYGFLNYVINEIINNHNGIYKIEDSDEKVTYKIEINE